MVLADVIKKAMLAGLGAQEKAKELIDELVKKGELSQHDATSLVKEWASKAEESKKEFDQKVKDSLAAAMEKLNIPSRDDVANLEKKIQSLSERVAKLEEERGASASA